MSSSKKNGDKGRSQKGEKKVPPTLKALPDVPQKDGNPGGSRQAEAVSKLSALEGMTAMTGTLNTYPVANLLSNSKIYEIGINLVHKLCLARPLDCSTTDTASAWTPAGAMAYLVWALFDSLRKAGSFQNPAMVNAFPPFPADGDIPVAWAQVLQYIKPYHEGSVSANYDDNTLTALPTLPTNATVGLQGTNFALGTTTNSGYFPIGAAGENVFTGGSGPTAWSNVYTAAPFMSDIWSSALSCCKYSQVPDFAPDASAYAIQSPGIGLLVGGLACFSPKFQPEISMLIGIGSSAVGGLLSGLLAFFKPTPLISGISSPSFWFVENFQLCPFLPGKGLGATLKQHLWNTAEFAEKHSPSGRIAVRSIKGSQPVRFLYGNTIPIDTRSFQALIGNVMLAKDSAAAGGYQAADVFAMGVVCMSALIAKLLPYSYSSHLATALNTAYDPSWLSVALPPAIAAVLNSLGPIAVSGRMHYPNPFVSNGEYRGQWLSWSTVGLTSATGIFFNRIVQGTNALSFTITNVVFSAANFATPANYAMTPVATTAGFMAAYNLLWQVTAPGTPSVPLVKPDSHNPVGKSNQLIMADVATIGTTANQPLLTATPLYPYQMAVSSVGAFLDVIGYELGLGIICPVAYPMNLATNITTVAGVNPPFRAAVGGVNRASALLAYAMNCNTSEVSEALGVALGSLPSQTYSINGNTVDVSRHGDIFGAILDKVVAPIFGDGLAEGIKSSPIGKIGKHVVPWAVGGPALYAADRLGITDGIVSTFAGDVKKKLPPHMEKALRLAKPAMMRTISRR